MLLQPLPYYHVDTTACDQVRLALTWRIKDLTRATPHDEEVLRHSKETAQAILIRGLDIESQRHALVGLLGVAFRQGRKTPLSAGFDRACDYWSEKKISEFAVAGSLILTYHSLYRQTSDDDIDGVLTQLAFITLTLFLLDHAEGQGREVGVRNFLTL